MVAVFFEVASVRLDIVTAFPFQKMVELHGLAMEECLAAWTV